MKVILFNNTTSTNIPTLNQFQHWLDLITKTIPKKIPDDCCEVCITIVDTEKSASLNKTYRQKHGPTNVLSFSYDAILSDGRESLGDLVICAEIVEAEAVAQHKSPESHWAHMTIHGILHLLGYDHSVNDDATIMETLEIKLLHQLGVENPYV